MNRTGFCGCGCGQKTKLATCTDRSRGNVEGEPQKYLLGHAPKVIPPRKEHFSYTITDAGYSSPCWMWNDCRVPPSGYAQIQLAGKSYSAHTVIYKTLRGPVPPGLELDHLCRNPPCVNPWHLEAVTHAENMRRGIHTILNWDIINEIRSSPERNIDIAKRLNIDQSHIAKIRNFKCWVP